MNKNLLSICLKGQIGRGGFSRIYSCVEHLDSDGSCIDVKKTSSKQLKAVKCIPNSTISGPLCMFECALMSKFRHSSLNWASNIGFTVDKVYIVQDLAISDLYEWRKTKFTSNERSFELIQMWSSQIVLGIDYLHSGLVLHGDIKAANVLLFQDMTCKLTDFTLSIRIDWISDTSKTSVCTTSHRPLEVWMGQPWDLGVDIWAFGCLLHELYFGIAPFTSSKDKHPTRDEMITKIKSFDVSLKSDDCSITTDQLSNLKAILQVDPKLRPTARDLRRLICNGKMTGETEFEVYKRQTEHGRPKIPSSLGPGLPEHLIWALFDMIRDIKDMKDSDKIKTGAFIYSKMIHGTTIAKGFLENVEKWITFERRVLKHVKFDIPL